MNDSADFAAPMSERFYVDRTIDLPHVVLRGDEARHLSLVLRAKGGELVTLFDGSGVEFAARISRVSKNEVELEIVERRELSRELSFDLTLAVALPKGERQKWLVEKLTELGVTRLVPLITERGVAEPVEAALDRLRRGVIEASKQCGRNRLMKIAEPSTVEQLLASNSTTPTRLFANPSGSILRREAVTTMGGILAAIGPEGGFAPGEVDAAREAGWDIVSLGPRILRVETAAIALAAW